MASKPKPEYRIDYKVVPSEKVSNTMYYSHRWSSPPKIHWLKEWKKATGFNEDTDPDCAFCTTEKEPCSKKAVFGAHVYYNNNGPTNTCCHIVPVCKGCNKKTDLFTLREMMKTLELNLADFIPEKVIQLKKNCEVKNVDGSSVDKRFPNWIQKWKEETGEEEISCSNSQCNGGSNNDDDDANIVGAHVYIKGTTENYYFIIPLCRSCNSKKDTLGWFKVISGTLAFGLKNEIDNLKKKKNAKEE